MLDAMDTLAMRFEAASVRLPCSTCSSLPTPALYIAHNSSSSGCTFPCAGTQEGYELYTVDHESGSLRLDLAHRWDDPSAPQART